MIRCHKFCDSVAAPTTAAYETDPTTSSSNPAVISGKAEPYCSRCNYLFFTPLIAAVVAPTVVIVVVVVVMLVMLVMLVVVVVVVMVVVYVRRSKTLPGPGREGSVCVRRRSRISPGSEGSLFDSSENTMAPQQCSDENRRPRGNS